MARFREWAAREWPEWTERMASIPPAYTAALPEAMSHILDELCARTRHDPRLRALDRRHRRHAGRVGIRAARLSQPTLAVMNGILALQGGGPFAANDDLDRRLIAAAGATASIVLPTADAYEHPERLVAAAMAWGERLDVEVEALMVMRRGEAMDDGAVGVIRGARAVYLVGDQPLHLRSVLKATPLWEAIVQVSGRAVASWPRRAAAPRQCATRWSIHAAAPSRWGSV